MAYYAVPMSGSAILSIPPSYGSNVVIWHGALMTSKPKTPRLDVDARMKTDALKPVPAVPTHPASVAREAVPRHHPRREPGALSSARRDLCGGRRVIYRPYRDRPQCKVNY